jgi:hypothetical protein
MMEFGDIFTDALPTTVFVYGSIAMLAAYALASILLAGRPWSASPAIAQGQRAVLQ